MRMMCLARQLDSIDHMVPVALVQVYWSGQWISLRNIRSIGQICWSIDSVGHMVAPLTDHGSFFWFCEVELLDDQVIILGWTILILRNKWVIWIQKINIILDHFHANLRYIKIRLLIVSKLWRCVLEWQPLFLPWSNAFYSNSQLNNLRGKAGQGEIYSQYIMD